METLLPEVHLPGDTCQDFLGPTNTQHLREDNVGKDEVPLRVLGPPEYPLPFLCQYGHESAPYCAIGCRIPASQLHIYPVPMALPDSVVHDSPIHMRPIFVMRSVSIDSLQQQVDIVRVGGEVTPPEENADLPDFTPESAHQLLQGVYGD